ncbi:MAG: endonuclease/exonuclease/phosphatase family protein [Phycisphaerales bacterium JB060]
MKTHATILLRPLALSLLLALSGCSEDAAPSETLPTSTATTGAGAEHAAAIEPRAWTGSQTITLDGDVSEWPRDIAAVADAHYLYLRFKLDGQIRTLQGMDTPVSIYIDADGDPATGATLDEPAISGGLGADIEIIFSPREPDAPRVGAGVMFRIQKPDGVARVVPHEMLGFSFAPTHASEWYEARIARSAVEELGLNPDGLGTAGRIAGVVVMRDGRGDVSAWADPFEVDAPPAEPLTGRDIRVPPRPDDAIRVLSYNVERSSPVSNPQPFARIIRVLDPDVLLLQEWDQGDADALRAWLTAHVDDSTQWHVLKGPAWGVAVASKHPLSVLTPLDTPNPVNAQNALRFVGGLAQTPLGPLAVGSTHLKCCGTMGSREDRQRVAEATAIADMLARALDQDPGAASWGLVVGGDLNLVGSRPPLEAIAAGADLDGSDLAVCEPSRLGDQAMYTWYDPGSAFTPGRLDFLLYSDAGAEAANSFVFDTGVLSEAALARLGLDATDTAASDHLPVVLDVRPTN